MTDPPIPESSTAERTDRKLDTKTVEVLALAVFRTLFREGLHVPVKIEGMTDLDLVVKDNNVLLNLNRVSMEVPELLVWRIAFAYQGKPVLEYGRGIKNDLKIHYPQLCFLLVAIWREKRRKNRAKARGDAVRDRELLTMSVSGPKRRATEEVRV